MFKQQDDHHQHQCGAPGELERLRRLDVHRVGEDQLRQRGDRLEHGRREELVAERGEQQRRGLARGPREREHDAGEDPGRGRRQHDAPDRPPAGRPEREGGLLLGGRHELQDLVGRSHDDREHQDAEGDSPRERREVAHRDDHPEVDDEPGHDRGQTEQHVHDEADPRSDPSHHTAAVGRGVVDEERDEDPERGREERREPHEDEGAHQGARDAARRVRVGRRKLGEEAPGDRGKALDEDLAEDQHERDQREDQGGVDPGHGQGRADAARTRDRGQRLGGSRSLHRGGRGLGRAAGGSATAPEDTATAFGGSPGAGGTRPGRPARARRSGPGPAAVRPTSEPGERVDDEREHEQDHGEGDQRRELEVAGLAELERDDARQRRPGPEEGAPDVRRVAQEQGDGDRLAHGAPEPERRRADDARSRPRQHRAADHLPARGAERVGRLLLLAGHGGEDLAGDGRDDRQHHDARARGRRGCTTRR